ncbi:MAG: DsbA family oxidoreductase [Acidobacteriota bacterium]|nr:DsbA family oxidoreductase [Acidobacteriota bacterium]
MAETLFVDLWSDVVCPFCGLGRAQLDAAITSFEHGSAVVVRLHAFELDPRAHDASDVSLEELIAKKYGRTVEEIRAHHRRLEAQAREYGFRWNFDRARPANTFDAHRLIALATTQDLGGAMISRLFRAYFEEGQFISDHDVLTALAAEVGVVGASDLWTSDDFVDAVRRDEATATELGLSGVPALVVDEKFLISGAQGVEAIRGVLERAWARREVSS